ncbi:hypothetical protein [Streptomyces sp. NPDC096934]
MIIDEQDPLSQQVLGRILERAFDACLFVLMQGIWISAPKKALP